MQPPMKSLIRFIRRITGPDAPKSPASDDAPGPVAGARTSSASSSARESLEDLIATGNQLEDAGEWDRAERAYRRASELYPGSARAWVNIGNLQSLRGHVEEACSIFARAAELDPGYAPAQLNLGNTHLGAGRPLEAEAAYRAALRINPGWTVARL